jgi:hypothetical protein
MSGAERRRRRSWSFEDKFIPKLELGNEVKQRNRKW